jgi:gliding motility-associated-like protein
MFKKLLYISLVLLSVNAFATHNRAGEITYTHLSGLKYEITVVTYTKGSSPADRPKLEIRWGDNSPLDSISRISDVFVGNDIKKNIYVGEHTYPSASPSPYIISVEDPNRNSGILNIPNSVNVIFYLQTELYVNPFINPANNSPVLLNPPIDNACVGFVYVHNPGAVDADGDSLYYTLQQSLKEGGQPIINYQYPLASNFITIDNFTGDLIWDSPVIAGEYNVAILIEEYRNGFKIGSILRDMQITVVPNCDPPPNITGIVDTCVIAGEIIDVDYNATGSHAVTLSATGMPFTISNPAIFQQISSPATITTGNFYWETQCNHVRLSPYFVSIKGVDDSPFSLADFHTTSILVIGPKPENIIANVQNNAINLIWDKTKCGQVIKYKIYRKLGPSGWTPGQCETGVPASTGFQLIATTNSNNDTTYNDNNNGLGLIPGEDYCYRVVACYANGAESIASDEVCNQLIKDVPIITNVSVNMTSPTAGSIYLAWSKPTEHDTIQYPGPFRYLIYRGEQSSANMVLIDSTATINDTTYIDTLLNTLDFQYFYRVDIYNLTSGARDLMGKSTIASSVYLNLTPSDNQLTLVWNEAVPWTNTQHIIYRQNLSTLNYDSINITSNSTYVDTGLINLNTYCYKVKSIGAFTTPNIINPILNYSQEACAQPIDNIIPCPPSLCVEVDCHHQQIKLHWKNYNPGCGDDILSYNIYKKDSISGEYKLITNVNNRLDSTYIYDNISSIVGCYVITGIDSVGNESEYSDSVCVDNTNGACEGNKGCVYTVDETAESECFIYRLPNVFTPGLDGHNDVFTPFPYRFVESVDMQIFNRWGELVFWSANPDILWEGTNQTTNKQCSDGTYYYVCTVNEICLNGIKPRVLKGFITLIKNKDASSKP